MDRFVGLDVHSGSTTMAIVGPSGRRLGTRVVETNGRALVEALKTVPRPCRVCLEEGIQAEWVYEILKPHVEAVVVVKVDRSRGQKSDTHDAFGLAERLRTGAVGKPIFKDTGPMASLRELFRAHMKIVADVVRSKNRLKCMFRARGVETQGDSVYAKSQREAWLKKLPVAKRVSAEMMYMQLDAIEPLRIQLEQELVSEAHRHPISRKLETCPGLGPIRAAQLMANVITPRRFRTKRQFWAYCGLAIVTRSSGDWKQDEKKQWRRNAAPLTRGLNPCCNRQLKYVFKSAAMTVILQPTSPLSHDYHRLVESGTKPNLARLTIARRIAAIALALWKHDQEYDPTKQKQQKITPSPTTNRTRYSTRS